MVSSPKRDLILGKELFLLTEPPHFQSVTRLMVPKGSAQMRLVELHQRRSSTVGEVHGGGSGVAGPHQAAPHPHSSPAPFAKSPTCSLPSAPKMPPQVSFQNTRHTLGLDELPDLQPQSCWAPKFSHPKLSAKQDTCVLWGRDIVKFLCDGGPGGVWSPTPVRHVPTAARMP